MSATRPLEEQLLERAESALRTALVGVRERSHIARLELLEACASRLGGYPLQTFRDAFPDEYIVECGAAERASERVLRDLALVPIQPALALAALAREPLEFADRRSTGAYYTDFRLATYVASKVTHRLTPGSRIVDPASGTGILLVACSVAACGAEKARAAEWLRQSVYAADISALALRGARLALASLTDDVTAVVSMAAKWKCGDSLLPGAAIWADSVPGGFDVVVANPPWEKLKVSRHEFARSAGVGRHYGADFNSLPLFQEFELNVERDSVSRYVADLQRQYKMLGTGEADKYKAFVELFFKLIRPDGCIAALVPAGLIRSQGTEDLRRLVITDAGDVTIAVLENRARFFAIDSRFKFLVFTVDRSDNGPSTEITLAHCEGAASGVVETGTAVVNRTELREIRPDLSVPEVRSPAEWHIVQSMTRNGTPWAGVWTPEIVREVDMTRERARFVRTDEPGAVPLIEGRMVHQHRFGAKRYVSGSGRRAVWVPLMEAESTLRPQFWFPRTALSRQAAARLPLPRLGFCDITGQTNERSMLSAVVPAGVICGNKVPTIRFPNASGDGIDQLYLGAGVLNSLPFDWFLRRIITTTVNYFLLMGVPLPRLTPDTTIGQRVAKYARELAELHGENGGNDSRLVAEHRTAIDIEVLLGYGLSVDDLSVMLHDFPLLDRAQPPLPGEERSTVTRDLLLLRCAERVGGQTTEWAQRFAEATKLGAVAYIPSEFGDEDETTDTDEGAE